MVMKNEELVIALETGAMPNPNERFNPAPSGRLEFGQVYVIPAKLRNDLIQALKPKKPVKRSPGGRTLTDEEVKALPVKGRTPE